MRQGGKEDRKMGVSESSWGKEGGEKEEGNGEKWQEK